MANIKNILIELEDLRAENEDLKLQNDFLQKELDNIRSMSMFEFANKYNSAKQQEKAGHMLAKSLLGGI